MSENIKVKVFKYGGTIHYEWESLLIEDTEDYVLVYGLPGRSLVHHTKEKVYQYDSYSIEYFPKNEWFTVNIDIYRNGNIEYYCNICMPPEFSNKEIKFIDLDIDIVRSIEGKWSVVDEDEYEVNSEKFKYPSTLKENVSQALDEILKKIEGKHFPFDGFFEKYIKDLLSEGKI